MEEMKSTTNQLRRYLILICCGSRMISVLSSLTMPVLKLRTRSMRKKVSETTLNTIQGGVCSSLKNVMPTGMMMRLPTISSSIVKSQGDISGSSGDCTVAGGGGVGGSCMMDRPDDAKESAKDGAKESAIDNAKDDAKESAKESAKDGAKESAKESAKDGAKESAIDNAKDDAKESAIDIKTTLKKALKKALKTMAKDGAKDGAKESAIDNAKDDAKDNAKENA
ncbi:hypothetical protein EYF80_046141 [Liparis tanakae]|uniref:Uncharacterized protein n=1 Tax=Liparis tanakae TaxID=230148 RepID=A0A4Z2FTG4_9TELE|nr:hypothetical protein EYF80_046141 [Liparis tanakae]